MTLFSRFSVLTRYVMVCVLLSMSVIALSAPPRWLRYLPKCGRVCYGYLGRCCLQQSDGTGIATLHYVIGIAIQFQASGTGHQYG